MKLNHQAVQTRRKISRIYKATLNKSPARSLIKNKRAMSAVISNIILITAVIVVGLAVLGWSQSQSATYQKQYGNVVSANIKQLQEKIVFECAVADSAQVNVYLLNSGTQNVTIASVVVNGQANSTAISLYPLGGTSAISSLSVGAQGHFSVPIPPFASSPYTIKIVTGRGSIFVGSS